MSTIDRPPHARNNDAPLWHDVVNTAACDLTVQGRIAAASIVEEIAWSLSVPRVRGALLAGATALRKEHPDIATAIERAYLSRGEVRP